MSNRPNVIFVLVDDLGVRDLGCYGSSFHETPNLDRLAKEGVRFTNAYASHPVCGPSRSAIMSGRSPVRLGVTNIGGSLENAGTVWPQVLKDAGYVNYFTGKWHMGNSRTVLENGFDYNIGGHAAGQQADYYYPYKGHPKSQSVPDMEDGKPGDYLTDKLTDKALKFIERQKDNPFLLYLSYYQTHKPAFAPAQGKKEWVEFYKNKLKTMPEPEKPWVRTEIHGPAETVECLVQRNPEFAGQISAVDENVGRIMKKLDELGIEERTIIIFTSDQGSVCTASEWMVTSQAPYRLGKSWLFEGGIRVPLIVKWPGKALTGSTNETITYNTDIYPTILDMLDLPLQPDQHQDGVSIADAVKGNNLTFDRTFYWSYPHSHSELGHEPSVAIRTGDYKLIYWFKQDYVELYNVSDDISEEHDLSKEYPEQVESLLRELNGINVVPSQGECR